MKNPAFIFVLILIGTFLPDAKNRQSTEIKGQLNGIKSDSLLVGSYRLGQDDPIVDTIPMKNGRFIFNISDSILREIHIFAKPAVGEELKNTNLKFILIPGKHIEITGSLENYTLKGDSFYEDYSRFAKTCHPYVHKIDSVSVMCDELKEKIGTDGITSDSIRKVYAPVTAWENKIIRLKKDFILKNPDNDLSMFLLYELPLDAATEYIDSLSEHVKAGAMAPLYQSLEESIDRKKAREKATSELIPGVKAPDFTLKDIQGNNFCLSSLKGQYVVLDFWGSWCGWCIKGFPEMKKIYEKYKGRIEFVSIDCNDTEQAWKKAVESHQLPWINVRNNDTKADATLMYGINGYPTKIIIDPEGKINRFFIGESPEFYNYIESLMKK